MNKATLIQERSGLSAQYSVIIDGRSVFRIEVPAVSLGKLASVCDESGHLYDITWDIHENKNMFAFRTEKRKFHVYRITDIPNSNVFGTVYRTRTKAIGGYSYYVIDTLSDVFQMYEIGLGKSGIKLPVFRGEDKIALLEKDVIIENNLDTYSVTYTTSESFIISILFGIYYDYHRFGNRGEYVANSTKRYYLYTTNKQLKSKYNDNWIK